MILVQTDTTPPELAPVKDNVLNVLQMHHAIREFSNADELASFLDEVLDGLVTAGAARGLTRVLMFSTDPESIRVTATRMLPGAHLDVMQPPGCWLDLAQSLDRLLKGN